MMGEFEKKKWEVGRLLSHARDIGLQDAEAKELQELLLSDPGLRRYYAELVATDSQLEQLNSRPLLDTPQLPGVAFAHAELSEESSDVEHTTGQTPIRRDVKVVGMPPEELFKKRFTFSPTFSRWLLATAALILVALLGVGYYLGSDGSATVVAVDMGGKEECELAVGDQIGTNWAQVNSGVVHVSFDSSAMVAIHGPAEFRAVGPNRAELRSGSLSVHVPKAAVGFAVATEEVDVVDLGTSFNMDLQPNGNLMVHVTAGNVEVVDKSHGTNLAVSAGQIATRPAEASDANALRLVETAKHSPEVRGQMHFAEKHPASLGFDAFDHDRKAFVFLESKRRRLPFDLPVNLIAPDRYTSFSQTAGRIPEGTIVDCYLIHCAPRSAFHEVRGSISFPGEILGIICDHDRLNATNDILGSNWTLRCNYIHRGLEKIPVPSADELTIQPDQRTIYAVLRNSAIDQFRVLVKAQ